MNAIYLSPNGNLYDYFNGKEDILNEQVRFIGNIEKRIQEMKSDNVIPLENWREYYNNKEKQREEKEKK